jgi:hypothetical protein
MISLRKKRPAPEAPARIRLSVLEPPCRCREPLVTEIVRGRRKVDLDLRSTECCRAIAPVLRGAAGPSDGEYLRVHTRTVSLPLLAAIQGRGHRFQIVARRDGHVEMIVWQLMTAQERRRYLRDGVDTASIVPSPRRGVS